jgi:hypothetical protein
LKPIHIGILVYWSQFVLITGPLGQLVYWDIGRSAGYGPGRFLSTINNEFCKYLSVPVQSQSASLSCRRMQSADHLDYWKIGLLVNWFIGALINWPLELLVTMVN